MLVVGLMSGTSLDGIDACLVEIHGAGQRLRHALRHFQTTPFPSGLRLRLARLLAEPTDTSLEAIASLNVELGEAFAAAVREVCAAADVPLAQLDLVGSHGQTLWHAPQGPFPASLQLGEPAVIAERCGTTVVANFRPLDLAAGGQGAPLVPYLDFLLFGASGQPVALQNLGGIGNVCYLPGHGDPAGTIAFDTGPGNMVIDGLVERLSEGRETYDRDGRRALAGRIDERLLAELLADPYASQPPPKSTGREAYGAARVEALIARARALGVADDDLVATATAWTARGVADQYRRYLPAAAFPQVVWVAGGGARNPALMAELARALAPVPVRPLSACGIDPDAKEALAFAILAYQCLQGEPNQLAAATGARGPRVLGQIVPGANFERALLQARAIAPQTATEAANPASHGLDALASREAVAVMHAEDYRAVQALAPALDAIAGVIEAVAHALAAGGRLFYVGAGTSGRLGVLDASECPPTFSSAPEQVQGLIAGGAIALSQAVEGAEDDAAAGAAELASRGIGPNDVVIGLSANGGAPYVRGALEAARAAGATTAIVTCNPLAPGAFQPDWPIVVPVGPEILAGSTRLKAGTATKLVLNMVSTLAMVRLGKVHDNLMVDVRISNRKLQARACGLVERLAGVSREKAEDLLARAGGLVKVAVVMHQRATSAIEAERLLESERGFLRPFLGEAPASFGPAPAAAAERERP